jgi:hypothetical protein
LQRGSIGELLHRLAQQVVDGRYRRSLRGSLVIEFERSGAFDL